MWSSGVAERLCVWVTCRERCTETRCCSTPPLGVSSQLAAVLAGAAGWGEAPAPAANNAVLRSRTRRQATLSKTLPLVPLVPVNFQPPTICFKCHLYGGRSYLCTTTTGPFVPASRDTNKQRPRLLRGSSAHPGSQTGTNRGLPPTQGPPVCSV